jgi:hypothetical protein
MTKRNLKKPAMEIVTGGSDMSDDFTVALIPAQVNVLVYPLR